VAQRSACNLIKVWCGQSFRRRRLGAWALWQPRCTGGLGAPTATTRLTGTAGLWLGACVQRRLRDEEMRILRGETAVDESQLDDGERYAVHPTAQPKP